MIKLWEIPGEYVAYMFILNRQDLKELFLNNLLRNQIGYLFIILKQNVNNKKHTAVYEKWQI